MTLRSVAAIVALLTLVSAAPADPCAKIAGKTFVSTQDALSCYKSFPLNETIRSNILDNAEGVLNFYTFEDYYAKSPFPYEESTMDIRGDIARIRKTKYPDDFSFQSDLYWTTTKYNDGHTRFRPTCYTAFQNILPAPVISLEENGKQAIYVAPNSVEFLSLYGPDFLAYFDALGFDWKCLAGAKVLSIEGIPAYDYIDRVAKEQSGNFLDHGIRVNSAFTSVRIVSNAYTQRNGDLTLEPVPRNTHLKFTIQRPGSFLPETVKIPFIAAFVGQSFTDKASYWKANCLATTATNGVDQNAQGSASNVKPSQKRMRADILDANLGTGVALPDKYLPTLPPLEGSGGVIKSYILPGNKTAVMFVGSFGPDSFEGFQSDVESALKGFKAAGATQLIIDLSDNGGGYVCLGHFLHRYLGGASVVYSGHESTARANPLAKKIVAADIERGYTSSTLFYPGDNWAFLNGTLMPSDYNYMEPSVKSPINGKPYEESQRFHDTCELSFVVPMPEEPPFDLKNVKIITNGWCASTCAMFSSLAYEKLNTTIAVFGGRPQQYLAFSGMAGNQVLDWPDLDTEIKTAGVKNDPSAPPDQITNANFRVNWRTAYSWIDKSIPIAYRNMPPQLRFAYTKDTYINPQNLWLFAEKKLFK